MHRVADIFGQITRVLFYLICIVVGAFLLYGAFNDPVRNTPWGQLTMNDQTANFFFMTIASIAFVLPLWLLFTPSQQKEIRELWAGFGLVAIIGITVFAAKQQTGSGNVLGSSPPATTQPPSYSSLPAPPDIRSLSDDELRRIANTAPASGRPQIVEFEGTRHEFPAGFSQQDIAAALSSLPPAQNETSMPLDLLDLAKSHQRPMPTGGTPTRQANGTSPQPNSTRREMIEVTGPDGRAFQFSPETTQASIKKAMEREYGRPATHSLDEELIKFYNSQR